MSDDDEIHLHVIYASHLDMDEAFCACMRVAIAAGLENAPTGVITTPGTKKPKHIPTVPLPRLLAWRNGLLALAGHVNWSRIKSRNRMRRQSIEDIKGQTPVGDQSPKARRRKLSKAEFREQAEAAFSGRRRDTSHRQIAQTSR